MIIRYFLRKTTLLLLVFGLLTTTSRVESRPYGNTAVDFLKRLYKPYEEGKAPKVTSARIRILFTHGMAALIEKDRASAEGEVGKLDYDPICNCQDFDRLKNIKVIVESQSRHSTQILLKFDNGDAGEVLTYRLEYEGGKWRIADICSVRSPCLKTLLR